MKDNNNILRLFKLYLEGKTNDLQEEILFRYLKDSREEDIEFDKLMEKAWLNQPSHDDYSEEAKEGLEQIWAKLEQKKEKKLQSRHMLQYAASVFLLLSAAFGYYTYQQKHPTVAMAPVLLSKITGKGEKVKMILPDSSVVYLGGGSKLTWPAHFIKGSQRKIRLEGEAFFEVKRDTTSPFIIYTGKMQTQVLGTSFNIYAYPADKKFSVAVRTGKVSVSAYTQGKVKLLSLLTKGMKLVYHHGTSGAYTISEERIKDVDSWIENRFVFRNESLANILEKLGRYYNVNFDLKSHQLAACRFNATFTNKNIKEVMDQISVMSGTMIRYRISPDNKTIALWGEGCQ